MWCFDKLFFTIVYTPMNFPTCLTTNINKNIPIVDIIIGIETFVPPTMKNIGVNIVNDTVCSLVSMSFLFVCVNCFDSSAPNMNTGNNACPPPSVAKNINIVSSRNIYFSSISFLFILNVLLSNSISEYLYANTSIIIDVIMKIRVSIVGFINNILSVAAVHMFVMKVEPINIVPIFFSDRFLSIITEYTMAIDVSESAVATSNDDCCGHDSM